jgi:hypothetical protein
MNFQSHPKWKYALGKSVIVQDEAEEAALQGEWFDLPEHLEAHLEAKARKIDEDLRAKREEQKKQEALDKQIEDLRKDIDSSGTADADIETLRVTATELGIDWHPRTGAKKLSEQIKAAIEAKGE